MNHKRFHLFVSTLLALLLSLGTAAAQGPESAGELGTQAALGTAFTYQGQLKNAGGPVNDTCDLQFSLWDAAGSGSPPTGGTQIGITQTLSVTVTNGLFTAVLNGGNEFGANAFTGDERWLQIAVRCPAGNGAYTTLAPRQALTAAPYALGLAPGTAINGSSASPLLSINNGDAMGLSAQSLGSNGVQGTSASVIASGVYGENIGGGYGVAGRTTGNGSAVFGDNADLNGYAGDFNGNINVTGNQSFGLTTRQMLNLWGTQYGIGVQDYTLYNRTDSNGGFAWYRGGTHRDAQNDPGPGGTTLMTLRAGGTLSVTSATAAGVIASGDLGGVTGSTANPNSTGVWGNNFASTSGSGAGVFGYGANNPGVIAWSLNSNPIVAYGSTLADREFIVTNNGNVFADGTYQSPAADFAELLPAAGGLEPGDVLVIGPDGKLTRSTQPYQTSVVGVYSTRPGFLGGSSEDVERAGKVPLAVVGVVPVKVSAENGAIRPGDLLTASTIPGHAMKATPLTLNGITFYPSGVVIGKALGTLKSGTGVIEMLVIVQ